MTAYDFDELRMQYIIEYRIVVKSPISIRSGREFIGAVDNPIIRIYKDGLDKPYIPGSSIKGVLRSQAERLAKTMGRFVCDIMEPKKAEGELYLKEKAKESGKKYEPCIVCGVFGGPTIASHVYFKNLYPLEDMVATDVVRRVSISRITGAQSPGKLFTVEYVLPGSVFRGEILIDNLDIFDGGNIRSRLWNLVFKMFLEGMIQLGGLKSVGYGRVEAELINVKKIYLDKDVLVTLPGLRDKYLQVLGVSSSG